MRRVLVRLLTVIVGLYVAYAGLMVWVHPLFIYPFVQDDYSGRGFEVREVVAEGATPVQVLVHQGRRDRPVVVYFMGNLGALDLFRPMLEHHRDKGRSVVAMTYRGGGGVPGAPTEDGLKRDALAVVSAVDGLVNARGIVVQGYSLGTGLAVHAAARHAVDGVVLSAPYDKLCNLMTRASALPACYLPVQGWKTVHDLEGITAPVLIAHGSKDQLIPVSMGQTLAARMKADGIDVTFHEVSGAGHNNLTRFPDYFPVIDRFVAGIN